MFELASMVFLCIIMSKAADSIGFTGRAWGGVTALLCVLSVLFVPLPFLRVGAIAAGVFLTMFILNLRKGTYY